MARRTKEDALKTRRRILASALSLFVKKGYDKTTFTDIASRLGMTKGAVYWHFESKEKLLVTLLDEMLMKFRRQISECLPSGGDFESLSFQAVADMMVSNAARVVGDAKGTAFFLLVHEQVKWSDASMASVRDDLMRNPRFGPWAAFRKAVENDIRTGRARADVDAVQVATVCMSMWDGLVHARIAKVLMCDLEDTLRKSYAAVRKAISA